MKAKKLFTGLLFLLPWGCFSRLGAGRHYFTPKWSFTTGYHIFDKPQAIAMMAPFTPQEDMVVLFPPSIPMGR